MDNTRDLPGYKYYVDAKTGERPAVYVAFLDLAPDPETTVNGVVFPATDEQLAALDSRERNYERREVTPEIDPPTGGTVYAYMGTEEARRRFETGRSDGSAVVTRAYLDQVRASFERLGEHELSAHDASTDAVPLPIRDLERIDLGPGTGETAP
jgi:gamma-glutamylcyclotransferase (GGCT)/AIG2-like uncharacterized protein YtfP